MMMMMKIRTQPHTLLCCTGYLCLCVCVVEMNLKYKKKLYIRKPSFVHSRSLQTEIYSKTDRVGEPLNITDYWSCLCVCDCVCGNMLQIWRVSIGEAYVLVQFFANELSFSLSVSLISCVGGEFSSVRVLLFPVHRRVVRRTGGSCAFYHSSRHKKTVFQTMCIFHSYEK